MSFAFALLVAALAVFWLSTRQFKQPWRLLVWLVGAAALAGSIWVVARDQQHFGLFRALADAWAHRSDIENSVLSQAFSRNAPSVARFIPQLLDLFIAVSAIIAALALTAFTRGEQLERSLRPAIFTLWGFMGGAITALTVVAIGFGGQVRPRGYFGEVSERDVHDGDTFWIGEMPLRLWGVDAPELNQVCLGLENCGGTARNALVRVAANALVRCEQRQRTNGSYIESFGRPLVQCSVHPQGAPEFDLGERLIEQGFAVQYQGDARYGYSDAEARGRGLEIMRACSISPEVWRRNSNARTQVRDSHTIPGGVETMGACDGERE